MAGPATPEDVAARWRPLSDAEYLKALTLLDDAWALLKLRNTTLEARLTAASVDRALVVMVQTAMVIRVLRNPDGKAQEAIEDYSYTRDRASASGELMVTDAELALLDVDATSSASGAFTIRPFVDTTAPGYFNWTTTTWDTPV